MSKLAAASMAVLVALCGLVFAIGFLVILRLHLPPNLTLPLCAGFSILIVGLQYVLGPLLIDHIVKIRWASPMELGPEFAQWLDQTCRQFKIPSPRFGIIEEGSPNAFTYGNGPWNARVVVTRGVIDALDPEELKAVVAHELGHIKHLDFIVMTVVQALVLALYTLYYASRYGNNRSTWYVVIASWVAYQFSYYISLLLSRIREYMADYASAQIMSSGNPLSSALVKISFGMGRLKAQSPSGGGARVPVGATHAPAPPMLAPTPQPAMANVSLHSDPVTPDLLAKLQDIQRKANPQSAGSAKAVAAKQARARAFSAQAIGAFGIAGAASMHAGVTWCGANGAVDPDHFTAGARWELYNPWARIAELISTHPLTARRIQALQKLNARFNAPSAFDFSKVRPGKYPGFVVDLFVSFMPLVFAGITAGAIALIGGRWSVGHVFYILAAYAAGCLFSLLVKYRGGFRRAKVLGCLGELNVSHVRPIPVVLQGQFTGRLSAGIPWADDYVLQDDSGFVACILNQPFKFLEFLWGWMFGQQFVGQDVIVYGWYRRFGKPFVEVSHFEVPALHKKVKSYYFGFTLFMSVLFMVTFACIGLALAR